MDVRSRCIVGWWLSEAESALSTLFALSAAVQAADHIPAMIHVDNGSGYAAQLHTDEAHGLLARLGISAMFAKPYNAKAKPVERFFLTFERSFGTRWPSFCGHGHDPETLNHLLLAHRRGEALLPTREQYLDGMVRWLAEYHAEEHPEVRGRSRSEVWAQSFARHAPQGEALFWPREERVVNRRSVWIDNRRYRHPALAAWNKTKLRSGLVLVEYDIHHDAKVRVLSPEGQWICDAELAERRGYVTESRIEDARAKRERAALKRLELHAQEIRDRAASVIDASEQLRQIEDATGEVSALEAELAGTPRLGHDGHNGAGDDAPEIDIWSD
jgi:putative transposase